MTMITATAIVSLDGANADANAHLSAEIDARPEGLNAGRSNFPLRTADMTLTDSQKPAFLLWSAGVQTPAITVLHGQADYVGLQTVSHDEDILQFLEPGVTDYTHRLGKPASSAVAWTALHPSGATVKSSQTVDGRTLSMVLGVASNPVDGAGVWLVGKVSYRSTAAAYRVTQDIGAEQVYFLASARPK